MAIKAPGLSEILPQSAPGLVYPESQPIQNWSFRRDMDVVQDGYLGQGNFEEEENKL